MDKEGLPRLLHTPRQLLSVEHRCRLCPPPPGWWMPGDEAEAQSSREAWGPWGNRAIWPSALEIGASGEQKATTWDAGREDGDGVLLAPALLACPVTSPLWLPHG